MKLGNLPAKYASNENPGEVSTGKGGGYPNLTCIDTPDFDKGMIKAVYLDVCKTEEWANEPPALREGLCARYENKCGDAWERLG